MNRTRQKVIATSAAIAVALIVSGFVAMDLYLWPQLRLPSAYLGAGLFAALVLAAIGAVVFHFVNEMDGHVEAKIETDKLDWHNAPAKAQAAPLKTGS